MKGWFNCIGHRLKPALFRFSDVQLGIKLIMYVMCIYEIKSVWLMCVKCTLDRNHLLKF